MDSAPACGRPWTGRRAFTADSGPGSSGLDRIPIATATAVAAQIGSGVDDATIHQAYPAFLGVSMTDGAGGATVADVLPGDAAESAGLAAGDVITSVDGRVISSTADLSSTLRGYDPGDRVVLAWTTPTGAPDAAAVTLAAAPAD